MCVINFFSINRVKILSRVAELSLRATLGLKVSIKVNGYFVVSLLTVMCRLFKSLFVVRVIVVMMR